MGGFEGDSIPCVFPLIRVWGQLSRKAKWTDHEALAK